MKDVSFLKNNLIAHRGCFDNEKIPENSISAFKKAINKGYAIELDVHVLKDGTVVVFHDDNLKRMVGTDIKLKDLTYDELLKYKLLNTNYRVPKLDEVLALISGKVPVIIEIKFDNKVGVLEKELVKILDNYKGNFAVKSFNPLSVLWFKNNRPEYIRGLLVNDKYKNIKEYMCHKMVFNNLCKPDFISCNYNFFNNKRIQKLREKMPVLCWTLRDKNNLNKVKDSFDNFICENII